MNIGAPITGRRRLSRSNGGRAIAVLSSFAWPHPSRRGQRRCGEALDS
jgi:hypothetical protein